MNLLYIRLFPVFCMLLLLSIRGKAQMDYDAIMMAKKNFCGSVMYNHSSWDHYWEGTFKRNNLNLGTVSTQQFSVMGNYGITHNLNILIGAPYIRTKASAGSLHGQHGVQDLSGWLKWRA